jgi:hypothetical protein
MLKHQENNILMFVHWGICNCPVPYFLASASEKPV